MRKRGSKNFFCCAHFALAGHTRCAYKHLQAMTPTEMTMRHDEAPTSRPASIPADAIGFISTRRRNGRIAAFSPNGALLNTWGFEMDFAVECLTAGGFAVDEAGIIRRAAR
jgi:hypothetical protein